MEAVRRKTLFLNKMQLVQLKKHSFIKKNAKAKFAEIF